MNERITILLVKAGAYFSGDGIDYSNFDPKKFAELIVRECANEILKWKSEPFPYDPEFGAKLIKEHFGIEK
jgi:hypothetical protein